MSYDIAHKNWASESRNALMIDMTSNVSETLKQYTIRCGMSAFDKCCPGPHSLSRIMTFHPIVALLIKIITNSELLSKASHQSSLDHQPS